jgi:hypothetical protein
MLIINNRFLSLYDYNFLLVIEKISDSTADACRQGEVVTNKKKPSTEHLFLMDKRNKTELNMIFL